MPLLLAGGSDVKRKDKWGRTPLHLAAACGHDRIVTLLLDAGSSLEAVDAGGDTPLHKAVWMGCVPTAAALIERGADMNAKDASGRTPLHWAVERKFTALAQLLRPKPPAQNGGKHRAP